MSEILAFELCIILMCFVIWKLLNAIDNAFGKQNRAIRDRLMAARCIALAELYEEDAPSCTKQTTEAYYERETNIRI